MEAGTPGAGEFPEHEPEVTPDIGDLNFGKVEIKFILLSRTALPIGEALFRRKTVGVYPFQVEKPNQHGFA